MTHSTVLFSNATTHSTVASLCTGVPSAPILQLHPPAQQASARNTLQFIMRLFLIVSTALFFHLSVQASSATRDTILTGQALAVNDKLVSKNGRYALGFFETRSKSSEGTTNWYLGIWFNTVPKFTPAWVANRDKPIKNITSLELTIYSDGNLVVLNRSTKSIFWSTHAKNTRNNTTAMLLSSGNLILINSSNSSEFLWQSFDYPTDTFFPGAKIGWDKVTGLNRRLVSWKNLIDPATGAYCYELDPSGVNQLLFVALNSSIPYWSTGVWNGKYFGSIPEMAARHSISPAFVDNDKEKYLTYNLVSENMDENMIARHAMDISGQAKTYIWMKGSQDWVIINAQPKAQCDVDAICGPFTICTDNQAPHCNCMEGFTITSPGDWELEDRKDGCSRNTQADCITNTSTTHTTDKFYSVPCVRLPRSARKVEAAKSASKCSQVCLNNCSCTAYSFGGSGCSVWHNELHNVKRVQCSDSSNSDGGTLYIRLSAKDVESLNNNRRGIVIGVAAGTGVSALGLFALILLLMIWRNKNKNSGRILNGSQGCNGIIAFRYNDLQRATKNFTNKLGRGSFGSVFKGFINDSNAIAVKRLDGAYQGEKQFRAEVSSIGAVQHINLVKLVGFCCEGSKRLLVYEYMSNRSLDVHLFRSNSTMLSWTARYQIALGIARGLAYLHDSCRDSIIHCDIKPENILLDASFLPKIADFGMAKILGRDFSRVLTTMRGTVGYLAPEWITGVAITPKVDVYGYGMVLLEIISGRRNTWTTCCTNGNLDVYFPVHAARKLLEGDVGSVVDQMLDGDVNLDEAELVCKVACWCIQDDEFDRPTMGEVVQILERIVEIGMPPIPRRLQALAGCLHSTGSSHSQRAS
ncbi:G-type lectin S-receptor-like serine/threonine-protein kinase At2g19130 [Brachypodium distachyon]|uniref:G-type lectin S-receptor-like serine/threonine-protein kinase At2g19130 n=1 Tax=Brachypodium distachyon TaxID=15368 RepID=UPI0001C75FAC|nr:G-type lectin S-receptor-like serine/threonine-protein kinase At2g19130 [Brachypodium distachyon]|eukprot:XP_003563469.2 G-type lectin S-receptor-like serine/threonine-protein kinase At2g19130 [Brachypodium distachyon]